MEGETCLSYETVLSQLELGSTTIKNRIARTAHGTMLASMAPGGFNDALIEYHRERAIGGVGLTILEICSVHPSCFAPMHAFDPEIKDGWKRMADAVKPHGMTVFQQLWHAGHSGRPLDGSPPWSASDIPSPMHGVVPTPMTKAMIDEMVAAYAKAASDVKASGLDGLDIHCAHSYLIQQFLSPATNVREDDYGGPIENRMRFMIEVLEAIRSEVGRDFTVGVRLSWDGLKHGMTVAENVLVLEELQRRDLIDYVNLSQGSYFSYAPMIAPMSEPTGYMMPVNEPLLKARKVPAIVTGRFRTLEEADQIIRQGDAEMVSMVRATIADPHLVKKTEEGREEEIRPCIACNQVCAANINKGGLLPFLPIGCAVNPYAGKESTLAQPEPAEKSKKVIVVGGGPAGMEAARIGAERGHNVTLFEAAKELGGQINMAKKAPFLHTIADVTDWQERELYRLGVDVRLSSYVEPDEIMAESPDAVIIATGSMPRKDGCSLKEPSLPATGVEQAHVFSSHEIMMSPPEAKGRTVLIADDVGHYEGIAVAEFLQARGGNIVYVSRHGFFTPDMVFAFRAEPAIKRLAKGGEFRNIPNAYVQRISNKDVTILSDHGVTEETVDADIVVMVSHNRPEKTLFEACGDKIEELHLVGDANSPRYIEAAIREGHMAGSSI